MDKIYIPHSEESERAVLSSVLLKPSLAEELFDSVPQEAFFLERHKAIYVAYRKVVDSGKTIDMRTVQASLEDAQMFDTVGGLAYLAGMDLDLPELGRFQHYCRIVRDRHALRELLAFADEIRRSVASGEAADAIVSTAEKRLAEIERRQLEASEAVKLGDLALDLDFQSDRGSLVGVTTGLERVDRETGGLREGHLVTLAGSTSMGKTALALGISIAAARSGKRVLFISLEMTTREILMRLMSHLSNVPHHVFDSGRVPNNKMSDAIEGVRLSQDLELWVCDASPQTPQSIAATARRHSVRHGLDLLVVDYLQLVKYVGPETQHRLKISEMAWGFKMLAKSLGVPVIELSQLRRLEGRRKPALADLKESGDIENHSDMVILCHREGYYDPAAPQHTASVIIAKARGGRTGEVEVAWDGPRMRFGDLEKNYDGGGYGW